MASRAGKKLSPESSLVFRDDPYDPAYIGGFVEGCLERIGADDPEGEQLLRGKWEEGDPEVVLGILKAGVEVKTGLPTGSRTRRTGTSRQDD
jgi:hypothetical protein